VVVCAINNKQKFTTIYCQQIFKKFQPKPLTKCEKSIYANAAKLCV